MASKKPFLASLAAVVVASLACLAASLPARAQQAAVDPVALQIDNVGLEKTSSEAAAPMLGPAPASQAVQALQTPQATSSSSQVTAHLTREHQRGYASWYGPGFHGKLTASGQRYDMHSMTAAHRTLPFGTMVLVKSLATGREVLVRITDRGPFVQGRILDLSRAAAVDLGMLTTGLSQVVLLIQDPTRRVAAVSGPKKLTVKVRR